MATGIIATLGASAAASYTPNSNAKMRINASCGSTGNVTVNGAIVFTGASSGANATIDVFVAAGTTVTVGTSPGTTCVVSALES